MKKIILIIIFGLFYSNVCIADEKEIIFNNEEEVVNSYQAKAISYGLVDKITDTLKTYIQESHVPFMFESKNSKIKFLPDTPLSELLTFKAVSIDLNNDGAREVIAYVSGNLVCGSSGCTSYILQGNDKSWKVIGELFPGEDILVLTNKTNGYLDINFDSKKYLCEFKDKKYQCN
jgi:hypothetical protein